MKRILATLLAAAALACYGTAQASRNAEEKAEQAKQKTHEANSFACTNIPASHHIILTASLPAEHSNGLALTLESRATENSA